MSQKMDGIEYVVMPQIMDGFGSMRLAADGGYAG